MKRAFCVVISFFIGTLTISSSLLPMLSDTTSDAREAETGVVSGAAYYVFDGADAHDPLGGIPVNCEYVSFYTFDGNLIERRLCNRNVRLLDRMLDQNAAKPQPDSAVIKYRPTPDLGFGTPPEATNWFIIFYDKHGNRIKSYRYDVDNNTILVHYEGLLLKFSTEETNAGIIDRDFPLDLRCCKPIQKELKETEKQAQHDRHEHMVVECVLM